jgi:glycosyltransferase involved in cell wall biosynthesis
MDLTILIVTRDRPHLLGPSIRSVLASAKAAEAEVNTHVLVIDDSNDGSAKPVAATLGVDYRQNPIRRDGNGLSVARAWALPQVHTDLIALFDDDDLMLEDQIPRQLRRIREGAEICPTGYWLADPDPSDGTKLVPRARPVRPRQPCLGDLLVGYQTVNDGAMMWTEVAQSVVWDPGREVHMMYDVWIQLLFAGRRFVPNPTATFLYRQHAASLTRNETKRDDEIRIELIAESRALAMERFGRVPGPSLGVRMSLAYQATLRGARRLRIMR